MKRRSRRLALAPPRAPLPPVPPAAEPLPLPEPAALPEPPPVEVAAALPLAAPPLGTPTAAPLEVIPSSATPHALPVRQVFDSHAPSADTPHATPTQASRDAVTLFSISSSFASLIATAKAGSSSPRNGLTTRRRTPGDRSPPKGRFLFRAPYPTSSTDHGSAQPSRREPT